MLKGYTARKSWGIPSLVKLTFFIQRRCEPVHMIICSAKTVIFHRCKVFVAGLVTVQVPTKNPNGNANKQRYWSNNIVFDGSQTRYFFQKTKLVRLQKANFAVVSCYEAQTKTYCDHFYKDSVSPN